MHEEKWDDPTFVTIAIFDIMVTSAEYQGLEWHMWLFYLPHFIESLTETYDASDPKVDISDEWPTRGSYLIYECFAMLRNWIRNVQYLPDNSPYLAPAIDLNHANGNIPKSAALALGQCMRTVANAPNIPDRFKTYLHEIVTRLMADLPTEGPHSAFRQLVMLTLVAGGSHWEQDQAYGETLISWFRAMEYHDQLKLPDYGQALTAKYEMT